MRCWIRGFSITSSPSLRGVIESITRTGNTMFTTSTHGSRQASGVPFSFRDFGQVSRRANTNPFDAVFPIWDFRLYPYRQLVPTVTTDLGFMPAMGRRRCAVQRPMGDGRAWASAEGGLWPSHAAHSESERKSVMKIIRRLFPALAIVFGGFIGLTATAVSSTPAGAIGTLTAAADPTPTFSATDVEGTTVTVSWANAAAIRVVP